MASAVQELRISVKQVRNQGMTFFCGRAYELHSKIDVIIKKGGEHNIRFRIYMKNCRLMQIPVLIMKNIQWMVCILMIKVINLLQI